MKSILPTPPLLPWGELPIIQCHFLVKPYLERGKEISLIWNSFRSEQKSGFCLERLVLLWFSKSYKLHCWLVLQSNECDKVKPWWLQQEKTGCEWLHVPRDLCQLLCYTQRPGAAPESGCILEVDLIFRKIRTAKESSVLLKGEEPLGTDIPTIGKHFLNHTHSGFISK